MAEFKDLKIKAELVAQLSKLRISTPTQIQEEAIPIILKKRNLIAKAQTGTGKTLAFLLPIMTMTDENLITSDCHTQPYKRAFQSDEKSL